MPDKILIVDDDELVLSCFGRLFGRRFNLETALGPKQALESLMTREPYAVVLSDMRMPGMTGVDLLTKVNELSPTTVGVLLTGNPDIEETGSAIRQGVIFKVVEKPCPPGDLIAILEQALARHHENLTAQHISAELLRKTS